MDKNDEIKVENEGVVQDENDATDHDKIMEIAMRVFEKYHDAFVALAQIEDEEKQD